MDALTELALALHDAGVEYDCQTRMSCLADPRLPELLSWGCRWLEIGLETANSDTLARYKQRSKPMPDDLLARSRNAGVPVCAYVGVGFPGETSSQMRALLDAVTELITRGLLHAANRRMDRLCHPALAAGPGTEPAACASWCECN